MKITHDRRLKVPTPKKVCNLSCTHGYSVIFLFEAGTFMGWWKNGNTELKNENLVSESKSQEAMNCANF